MFALSFGVYMEFIPFAWFFFHSSLIWQFPPQLWRLVTAFWITSPKLGILFDTFFLYSNMSRLERGHPRFPRKEDLVWYLMFICGTILVCISSHVPVPSVLCLASYSSYICPDSALPPQLSRFLKTRKITPGISDVHHSQSGLFRGVGHGGMSYGWLV